LGGAIFHTADGGLSWIAGSATSNDMAGVWGSGSGDVYVVGDNGTILHTTNHGATWTPQASGKINGLVGVWGSSSADVYAVGTRGTILHLQ
jgi:photosystem II stability/assembly factor-like uncharacterized protein